MRLINAFVLTFSFASAPWVNAASLETLAGQLAEKTRQANKTPLRRIGAAVCAGAVLGAMVGLCIGHPIQGLVMGSMVGAGFGAKKQEKVEKWLDYGTHLLEQEDRQCKKEGGFK